VKSAIFTAALAVMLAPLPASAVGTDFSNSEPRDEPVRRLLARSPGYRRLLVSMSNVEGIRFPVPIVTSRAMSSRAKQAAHLSLFSL